MLMFRFYELWKQKNQPPIAALSQAQRWLRDTTNAEKMAHFQSHIAANGRLAVPARAIGDWLAAEEPGIRSNQDPVQWAAFAYVGA
jgi:CHAT domain-containing protein